MPEPKEDLRVTITRDPGLGYHSFQDVFKGFERVSAVRSILGPRTDRIIAELTVDVQVTGSYLYIDDNTGRIVVDRDYLRGASLVHLYLDVVHELVHIRQLDDGLDLFDDRYSYVDRPTELEAYREAVEEARKIGLTEREIADYLRVEWIGEDDFRRFLSVLGIES